MLLTSPLLAALLVSALSVEATPLAGEPVQGVLRSLNRETVVIETADGAKSFPLRSLRGVKAVDATLKAPEGRVAVTKLRDDSQLQCDQFTVNEGIASLNFSGLKVTVPVGALQWVRLRSLEKEPNAQQDWENLLNKPAEGDRLAFARESDEGLIVENLTGALFNVDEKTVEFQFDGERVKPNRDKVIGLIYLTPRRDLKETVASVLLTDGSLLAATELDLKEDTLRVVTAAGLKADVPLDQLLALELSMSNTVYLSDLKPVSVDCEPYFGVVLESERKTYLPRMDVDHHGNALKLSGQEPASKGLALRSHTTLVYRFQKPYKQLLADVGIAEHVRESEVTPHLKLVITSDNKTLLDREISGDQDPFSLQLDLTGVQRVTIEVQYGKSQDIADYLHLCNARLLK